MNRRLPPHCRKTADTGAAQEKKEDDRKKQQQKMRTHILLLPDTQEAFTSQKNRVKAHEKQLWPARSQQQEPPCAIFPPAGCFLWFQGKQAIRFIRQAAPASGSTALSRQANSLPASRRIRAGRQHALCSPSAQPVPGTGTLLTTGETALPRRRAAGRPIRETFPGQPAHSPPTPRGRKRGATVCSSCGSSVPPSCSPRYARCRRADCRRSRCRSVPRVL